MPLILYGGHGWHHGLEVPQLVRHVDLLPTLADLAGVEIDVERLAIEGRSVVPLLRRDAERWTPRLAYAQRRPADAKRLARGRLAAGAGHGRS